MKLLTLFIIILFLTAGTTIQPTETSNQQQPTEQQTPQPFEEN